MTPEEFRKSILDNMVSSLSKSVEHASFYKLNDPNVPTRIRRVIPTGLLGFDIISARTPKGNCGLPISRQIELFSTNPGAGKTSLACLLAGAAQKRLGWVVKWCEGEGKLDPARADKLGLDTSNVLFSQPDCLEDLIDIIDKTLDEIPTREELDNEMKNFGALIVVDSIASFPSRVELNGDMDKNNIGVFQRKMSQAQRRITSKISKRNVTILWLNQSRDKIAMGPFGGHGGKTTYGGNAIKFHCAQRWELVSIGSKKDKNGSLRGINIIAKNRKNQCGVFPFLETNMYLDFANGFDIVSSLIEAMENLKIASRTGRSLTFSAGSLEGKKIESNKFRNLVEEDSNLFYEYERLIPKYLSNYNVFDRKKNAKQGSEESE